jgi:hypothetical protein
MSLITRRRFSTLLGLVAVNGTLKQLHGQDHKVSGLSAPKEDAKTVTFARHAKPVGSACSPIGSLEISSNSSRQSRNRSA